jgi:hypothetical protein
LPNLVTLLGTITTKTLHFGDCRGFIA